MSDFAKHLDLLIGTSGRALNDDRRAIEQWTQLSLSGGISGIDDVVDDDIDNEEPWPSVLDLYTSSVIEDSDGHVPSDSESAIDKILSNPHMGPIAPSILSILSSTENSEIASNELVELIGFENIELVPELIAQRKSTVKRLEEIINRATDTPVVEISSSNKKHGKRRYQESGRHPSVDFSLEAAQRRIDDTLRANAARPLFTGTAHSTEHEILPHVYTSSSMTQSNVLSHLGTRYLLPVDTTRTMHEEYEEVIIPPAKSVPPRSTERAILISELDDLCSGSFPGYATLNRIQSIVYSTAYETNENMLICAPTGAGKTDVAMLSILHVINEYRMVDNVKTPIASQIDRNRFKIIYVAPMKALAAEIVRKLGKRLKWLAIQVKELTGDMQLTRAEIDETQIIVTTPEKWDVVTRKPTGEGELASKVRLLIIDEVHLLNDERGAVIETIVARTLRQVESTQSMIRIVGLSATLPNYVDVADFLGVSRQSGLFYFDSSFRPIPLEQHFLGIKGKNGSQQARRNLDRVTFEKVRSLVEGGHQVMVFVHARKETVKTALALKEAAVAEGAIDDFKCETNPGFEFFRREVGTSKNKEMKQLFEDGFGIHHAGMLRSDRNLMEKAFDAKMIKVLCCTATLAWGVNLPAHAVIIKGTQVYDTNRGKFVDLSVLDVLQIFGRAGRPGLETSGEGYICTSDDTLQHYLEAITAQHPIESKMAECMTDALNAEIALGTVASVSDAVQWLGYTYLFVRMRKNHRFYGIKDDELLTDPQLGSKREELIKSKATELAEARMIIFDQVNGTFAITDLGGIAAKYYLRSKTVLIFNEFLRNGMDEADLLHVLCKSTEFDQIQLREEEIRELEGILKSDYVRYEVKDGVNTSQGKVNILLQAHISRVFPEDFALVSDMAYVAQNAGRILRALLEIAISRKWAGVSAVLMSLGKAVEKRRWPEDHPFLQLGDSLKREVLSNVQRWADDYSVWELAQMSAHDIGELVHLNDNHGAAILRIAKEFATLDISYACRPLSYDLLQVSVHAERSFTWGSNRKNSVEPFWIWLEDSNGVEILQSFNVIFRQSTEQLDLDFTIQTNDLIEREGFIIRYISDRWMGAEDEIPVTLDMLIKPQPFTSFTSVLPLPFLSLHTFGNDSLRRAFGDKISDLNTIQTQAFWGFVNVKDNALLCAPSGSGKSTLASIAIAKCLQESQYDGWCMVLLPNRRLISKYANELSSFINPMGITIEVVTSSILFSSFSKKVVRLITPTILIQLMDQPQWTSALEALSMVVVENLELLDAELELSVSLLLHACQRLQTRFLGLSACLLDPTGLVNWLKISSSLLYAFQPKDREQDLRTLSQSFTLPYSAHLVKAMAKPAHTAIVSNTNDSILIFVPSRQQCKAVANDLVTRCLMDLRMQGYRPNHVTDEHLAAYLHYLQDQSLVDLLNRGIGVFYDDMSRSDRALVLDMYEKGVVRVLILPRQACWSIPLRAGVVIAMGTQYVRLEGDKEKADRQVKDYSFADILRMQGLAVRHGQSGQFYLFCPAEKKDILARFMDEGLPLESTLHRSPTLANWIRSRWKRGIISENDKQQTMDVLSWTYLARRMADNPTYYDTLPGSLNESLSRLVDNIHAPGG